jgi:hypothetical protein
MMDKIERRIERFEPRAFVGAVARGVLVILAVAAGITLATTCAGCDNPVRDQARAATIAAGALTAGGDVVMAARASALDRVEAEYPADPEHDEHLDVEAARGAPVLVGLDAGRSALLVWIDSLELAQAAGGGADLLAPVITLGMRTLRLVADAFALATSLGVEGLPTLPVLGGL